METEIQRSAEIKRTTEEMKAEIEKHFGFFPSFFIPALKVPEVLEFLWQQTLSSDIHNPIPELFKEKLFTRLSRHCPASYPIVFHSCALRALGMTGGEVLNLLEEPSLKTEKDIEEQTRTLARVELNILKAWPEMGKTLEQKLLRCAEFVFLNPSRSERYGVEMRRLLGTINYSYLVIFLSYIKTYFSWVEFHPEISYEADKRVQENLESLLQEEPRLTEAFKKVSEPIRQGEQTEAQTVVESVDRKKSEETLQKSYEELKLQLQTKTQELAKATLTLQAESTQRQRLEKELKDLQKRLEEQLSEKTQHLSSRQSFERELEERKKAEEALRKMQQTLETQIKTKTEELSKIQETLTQEASERKRLEKESKELHKTLEQKATEQTQKILELNKSLEKEVASKTEELAKTSALLQKESSEHKCLEQQLKDLQKALEAHTAEKSVHLSHKESLEKELTEHKKSEETLRQSQQLLEAEIKEKTGVLTRAQEALQQESAEKKRLDHEMEETRLQLQSKTQELKKELLDHRKNEESLQKSYDTLKAQLQLKTDELTKLSESLQLEGAEKKKLDKELKEFAQHKQAEESLRKSLEEARGEVQSKTTELAQLTESLQLENNERKRLEKESKELADRKAQESTLQKSFEELRKEIQIKTETLTKANDTLRSETLERKRLEKELTDLKTILETQIKEKTQELSRAVASLETGSSERKRLEKELKTLQESLSTKETLEKELAELRKSEASLRNSQELLEAQMKEKTEALSKAQEALQQESVEHKRLEKESKELADRKAQESTLQKSFEELRKQSDLKTQELAKAAETLQAESAERKRAQEALQKSHDDLALKLEARTQELAKAKEALQAITDPKKADQILQESNRRLGEFDRLKAELTHLLNHQLIAPLTSIKEGIALVLQGSPGRASNELNQILQIVKNNIDRLHQLLNNLFDISKIEAGQIELRRDHLELPNLIEEVISTHRLPAKVKTIQLSLFTTPYLPPVPPVEADHDRLRQVINNLVDNAIRFTPNGGEVNILAWQWDKKFVCIGVKDNGIGIKKEDQNKLFGKFQKMGGENGKKTDGMGLGLAVCKGIVEAQGGKIWVESEYGKGSSFYFTVPIYQKEVSHAQAS